MNALLSVPTGPVRGICLFLQRRRWIQVVPSDTNHPHTSLFNTKGAYCVDVTALRVYDFGLLHTFWPEES